MLVGPAQASRSVCIDRNENWTVHQLIGYAGPVEKKPARYKAPGTRFVKTKID
jgi:hypothetical protein